MKYSLNSLYKIAGVSKQAVHSNTVRDEKFQMKLSGLIMNVDILREAHPGCGLEKMYKTLCPDFIGRDRFIDLFMSLGYRVNKPKNYVRTTIPTWFKYSNYIEGLIVYKENQLWQTDITYYQVMGRYYYLVFIIDVYTRKIGHQVSDNLRADANLKALRKASSLRMCSLDGLIHHSDRGSQYVEKTYVSELLSKGIYISMGAKGQDNAYAERINGTIKNEYLKYWDIDSLDGLKLSASRAVRHYNTKRPHSQIYNLSPVEFEKRLLNLNLEDRPVEVIYSPGKPEFEGARALKLLLNGEPPVHVCQIVFDNKSNRINN
ncbi:MAG: transposase [Bacteroidales bacterium]